MLFRLKEADVEMRSCTQSGKSLLVTWGDGHQSVYSVDVLASALKPARNKMVEKRFLWDSFKIQNVQMKSVTCGKFMSSDEGLQQIIGNILTFGFGMVTGVEPTVVATRACAVRLTIGGQPLQNKIYVLDPDHGNPRDISNSRLGLFPHTGGSYMQQVPGLMVFHCLHHQGSGALSVLVDGFQVCVVNKQSIIYLNQSDRLSQCEEGYGLNRTKHYSFLKAFLIVWITKHHSIRETFISNMRIFSALLILIWSTAQNHEEDELENSSVFLLN